MPISYTIESDKTLEEIRKNLSNMPKWMPAIVRKNMPVMGRKVVREMKLQVADNRYKGTLEDSIKNESSDRGFTQVISPTAKRGRHDAGKILELGTRPHAPPWAPIAEWAEFRGLPAFPIWFKIKTKGTNAYPFVHPTLNRSKKHINEVARRMGEKAAEAVILGTGTRSA